AAQGTPILCFDINEMAPLAAEGDPRHVAPYLDLAALADELARLLDVETLTEDRDAMLAAVARAHGPAAFADLLVDLVRSRGDGWAPPAGSSSWRPTPRTTPRTGPSPHWWPRSSTSPARRTSGCSCSAGDPWSPSCGPSRRRPSPRTSAPGTW